MGFYKRVTGSTGNETRIKEPKPFKPIELEQAFGGAYRSYRINGKPKLDVDTFFNRIRKELIELIERELKLWFSINPIGPVSPSESLLKLYWFKWFGFFNSRFITSGTSNPFIKPHNLILKRFKCFACTIFNRFGNMVY